MIILNNFCFLRHKYSIMLLFCRYTFLFIEKTIKHHAIYSFFL